MSQEPPRRFPLDALPAGTVTFLFTDIEGSTSLMKQLGEKYKSLLADQRRILRGVFSRWDGQEVDTQGDAFFISFPRATDAAKAAVESLHVLAEHNWPEGVEVRVRIGLHTGEPWRGAEGYVGMDVHRAARIAHAGHGGQVLLSETTTALVRGELPEGVSLIDLGRHRLKDIRIPERICQLAIEGMPSEFPALRSLQALPAEFPTEFGPIQLPRFLEEDEAAPRAVPVFVRRERELERLGGFLAGALAAQGGVAFITGGPGRGKSALMDAFARRAMAAEPSLLVASGSCSAFAGVGDPYLPFREIMNMLAGEVEERWKAGAISRERAIRLWEGMPHVVQALVESGPNLVEVFVSGAPLLARLQAATGGGAKWLERLAKLVEAERPLPGDLEQQGLFEQYEDVLGGLAAEQPLLLLLDDLQWSDEASIHLLFHLGCRLSGKRVLLIGAYRPEEVAVGRGEEKHPLEAVLAEFKRQCGDVWIDLGETNEEEDRGFVEAYLQTEPNRLARDFREALYRHTGGHPLFTVELLRHMQERGDLVQDEERRWTAGPGLDWDVLPAKVEGVIEERIARLVSELRETLSIASVEGDEFTAQVVAQVQAVGERQLLGRLSRELEKRHRLVRESGPSHVGERTLYQYQFTHRLIQQFLYNDMGIGERQMLHGEIARVLEDLYADQAQEIAVQLAHHYLAAEKWDSALHYLQVAGDRARAVYANAEAVEHYQRALTILKRRGDQHLAARTLMKLGLTYHTAFEFQKSREAYEEGVRLWRQLADREITPPAVPERQTLRACFEMSPKTLDPTRADTAYECELIESIFAGLLELTPDMEIEPDVARSWDVLEGGRRYIFHLREDAVWSDGVPVTAHDFEYAWRRILDPEHKPVGGFPIAFLLYDIRGAEAYNRGTLRDSQAVGVRALNGSTLSVELEEPTGYFLHLMAVPASFPVPRHAIAEQGELWAEPGTIVTNGPFRIVDWSDDLWVLERNPTYHGRFRGNVERVEVVPGEIPPARLIGMYEANGLDYLILGMLPLDICDQLRQQHSDEYLTGPMLYTCAVAFDLTHPPFDDHRVRMALASAIDKENLAHLTLRGYGFPATGGCVPPGIAGHSPDIGIRYDPDRARELLAEAGYPGGEGFPEQVSFAHETPMNKAILHNLAMQWDECLGIKVRWDFIGGFNAYSIRFREEVPRIDLAGWVADYPDPDNFLRGSWKEAIGWDHSGYDGLIEAARHSMDQDQRLRLYRQADEIIQQEVPIFPLTYGRRHYLVKPWVKEFPVSPIRAHKWKYITLEPH